MSHARMRGAPRRFEQVVNTVGLLPILAELAGVPVPKKVAQRSFTAAMRGDSRSVRPRLSYSETSRYRGRDALILNDRYKLLTEWSDASREFYDLAREPAETPPLKTRTDARDLLSRLVALRSAFRNTIERRETNVRELHPEEDAALRALGYVC